MRPTAISFFVSDQKKGGRCLGFCNIYPSSSLMFSSSPPFISSSALDSSSSSSSFTTFFPFGFALPLAFALGFGLVTRASVEIGLLRGIPSICCLKRNQRICAAFALLMSNSLARTCQSTYQCQISKSFLPDLNVLGGL